MFNFEKLEAWKRAVDFADTVYRVIAEKQSYLSPQAFRSLYSRAEELSRMLSGLRKHLIAA